MKNPKLTQAQIAVIDQLLELLPSFENPEFVPATWSDPFYFDKDGVRQMMMPYPSYHPVVAEFLNRYPLLADGIHPYEALPEDETREGVEFNVLGTTFDADYFANATIDQIRRYFMLLGRGERFCDGHIDGEFKEGKVVAALHRLAVLRG
ncbi:MAG: hypothetical protein IT203_10740 [Fimbriimonadaceae bacterium]|nr:hypothetical protein [Fimbriimonadaceae bacterium]